MIGLLVVLIVSGILTFAAPHFLPQSLAYMPGEHLLPGYLLFCIGLVVSYLLIIWRSYRRAPTQLDHEGMIAPPALLNGNEGPPVGGRDLSPLTQLLRERYGDHWQRKIPWLLVMGEVDDVERVAPGLTAQGGLLVGQVLLLWGGSLAKGGNMHDLQTVRRLRRHRPVDALIWVSHAAKYTNVVHAEAVRRGHEQVRRRLRWEAPVYLLDTRELAWPLPAPPRQLVGVLQAKRLTPESLISRLEALIPALRAQAMAQINTDLGPFLLRLSSDLQHSLVSWRDIFTSLLSAYRPLPLYGVTFSPPLSFHAYTPHEQADSPIWRELASGIQRRAGRPVGITALAVVQGAAVAMVAIIALGVLVSWGSNHRLVTQGANLVQQANVRPSVSVLFALQQQIQTLLTHQQQGAPLYRRVGLDVTDALLPTLWPAYAQLAQRFIVQPAQLQLSASLTSSSPSYDQLKTYLMLAHPEKTTAPDAPPYFAAQLTALLPTVPSQTIAFFTRQFAHHHEWKITPDSARVAHARAALLHSMSGPQAEARLYQLILDRAALTFGDLSLMQLLDGLDAEGMFTLDAEVPGRFTRQAYDGAVFPEIATRVTHRQEQINWVLVEPGEAMEASLLPSALGARLTARYLADYARAWQQTLNQVKARPANPAVQLSVAADLNRSPQMALMKQLAWQGLAGSPNEKHHEVNPALQPVFGGVVAMVSNQAVEHGITLTTWRMCAASLRDQMRHLSAANGGTAALSQSVFSGTQIDNTIAELPGRLRNQLGTGWQPMTQALLLAPLSQSWKTVMIPGVKRMNVQWQAEIVGPWHQAFDHTFPFVDSRKEASLPTLNTFINPLTGRIVRFINEHLRGVLTYKNHRWQVADTLPPGLSVNPQFLTQLNHLDQLGRTLNGNSEGIGFQLQAGTARDVVKTELRIDGQTLTYVNQQPFWQDMQWPGETYYPRASLIWTSIRAGARLYFDTPGVWAFYRLLKKAKVTQVDDTHYQLTWRADDGLQLNYQLAFTPGHDPLSLLSLENFQFPSQIFR
ncbi:ImcF-related family protein [Acerihabitans sp. TG2]|uniref:ImcF-related family protein n=1 Tax=Acerihabitans sp. TG2 TaxID=3096008 RepID=UPI002B2300FE|nr:ImcF-related family protein [Acerihabitans sp. TG2]MEA9389773.1 ImcF-related family protein [Acerihabitans sp. TG2]